MQRNHKSLIEIVATGRIVKFSTRLSLSVFFETPLHGGWRLQDFPNHEGWWRLPEKKGCQCFQDKTIKIWSLETFSSTKTLYGHTSRLVCCVVEVFFCLIGWCHTIGVDRNSWLQHEKHKVFVGFAKGWQLHIRIFFPSEFLDFLGPGPPTKMEVFPQQKCHGKLQVKWIVSFSSKARFFWEPSSWFWEELFPPRSGPLFGGEVSRK